MRGAAHSPVPELQLALRTAEELGLKSPFGQQSVARVGRIPCHDLTKYYPSRLPLPKIPIAPLSSAHLTRTGPSLFTGLCAPTSVHQLRRSALGRVPVTHTCPQGRSAAATAWPQPPPPVALAQPLADLPPIPAPVHLHSVVPALPSSPRGLSVRLSARQSRGASHF